MENESTNKVDLLEAPANLQVIVNDDEQGVILTWEDTANHSEVVYKLYLNGEPLNIFSNTTKLHLTEMVAGVPYIAQIQTIDRLEETGDSVLSNPVEFEILGLVGEENPTNWIGVRLDNLTVIYEK